MLRKKKLEMFYDASVWVLYGTESDFKAWYKKITKKNHPAGKGKEPFPRGICGTLNKPNEDGRYVHYVYVNSDKQSIPNRIGTLAHEANHYIDRLFELMGSSSEETVNSEFKSRLVQTVVATGVKQIFDEEGLIVDQKCTSVA